MYRNEVSLPTLGELSGINAENNPDRTAFVDGERRVSWSEFHDESRRAAGGFDRLVDQGDRVAFLCESSVDQTVLWNGALQSGAIVTNLHYRAATDTIAYCIESTTPKVLVVDAEFSEFVHVPLFEIFASGLPLLEAIAEEVRLVQRREVAVALFDLALDVCLPLFVIPPA